MDRIVRAVKQVTSRRLYNRPVSRPTNPATRSIFARLSSWTRQPPSPIFGGTAGNFAADPTGEHPELLTGVVHEMDPAALTAFRRVAPL